MANVQTSVKRIKIEQSHSRMIIFASLAVFLLIFSVSSSHALWNKLKFQNKVINAKTIARNQLSADVTAANQLGSSYENFNNTPTNLLGSAVTGKENDNAKIVLDALPSQYDFPALTTSVQSLLNNQGVTITSISGTDQSVTLGSTSSGQPVPMPFSFTITGPYQNVQNAVAAFEKSIRPFQFQTITLSGDQSNVTLSVNAQTYFQPATQFTLKKEAVK